jgi:hypothetical protein
MSMKKKIVYILSTGHAGSHYLSLMLGSNSKAVHAGELFQLGRPPQRRKLNEVFLKQNRVLEGIGPDNIEQVYDIIFSRTDPKTEVLVDNSKIVRGWAERFVDNDQYDRLYIHLIRDPRAIVRRFLMYRGLKNQLHYRWKLMRNWRRLRPFAEWCSTPTLWLYRWLLENRRITEFIDSHRLNATLVTYRDLAKDSGAEVRRLTEWMGLTYEPGQLDYWNFQHIGTEKRAYEWVKEQKVRYFDLRWKTDLPLELQKQISHDRLVNQYLRQLGLAFTDEGATRLRDPYSDRWPHAEQLRPIHPKLQHQRAPFEFLPLPWLRTYRELRDWFLAGQVAVPSTWLPLWRQFSENWVTVLVSCGIMATVAVLDYLTGPHVSVAPFYLIPCAVLASVISRQWGTCAALITAVTWSLVHSLEHNRTPDGVALWNCLMHFILLQIVVLLLSRIRIETVSTRSSA